MVQLLIFEGAAIVRYTWDTAVTARVERDANGVELMVLRDADGCIVAGLELRKVAHVFAPLDP